jgi:hypothetical protein
MSDKPAHILKEQLKVKLNNMFDVKKTTLKQRREARHKLQNLIESKLIYANPSLLKKIYIMIESNNYQQEKHKKYYKNE